MKCVRAGLLLGVLALTAAAFAQDSQTTAQAAPNTSSEAIPAVTADPKKDPAEYLKQVAATMLQRAPGNPAFHIKADFKEIGPLSSGRSGSYEETWISPEKWRQERFDLVPTTW